jgi:hypothetical protein
MMMKNVIFFGYCIISLLVSCITPTNVKEVEPLDEGIGFQIVLGVLGDDAEIIDFESDYGGDRLEAETKDGRILVLWRLSGGDTFSGTLAKKFNPNPVRERVYVRKYNETACFKGFKPAKGCWEARIGDKRFDFLVIDPLKNIP